MERSFSMKLGDCFVSGGVLFFTCFLAACLHRKLYLLNCISHKTHLFTKTCDFLFQKFKIYATETQATECSVSLTGSKVVPESGVPQPSTSAQENKTASRKPAKRWVFLANYK